MPVAAALPERQFTLYFDDVRVGPGQLVGDENDGFTQVFHGLNPERITGAAICVGIGRYALDRAAEYARGREVWGVPIGAHQGVSHPLAKAKIEVELAALMTAKAAWLHDHDQPAGEASNMAKYAAAEAALAAVTRPSRPTAATAWPRSTGWSRCGAWPGCSASPRSTGR